MEVDSGRSGFTQPPSALQFRTLSISGRSREPKTNTGSGFTSETRTGMTSEYTEDERRSVKSEEDGGFIDYQPTQSFMERWRRLDVDEL
jgi:hypothetical protein